MQVKFAIAIVTAAAVGPGLVRPAAPVDRAPVPPAQERGPFAALKSAAPEVLAESERSVPVLFAQVMLDRRRHSPGVIDGLMGGNTERAIASWQREQGLAVTGEISKRLLERLWAEDERPILQRHRIGRDDVDGPFRRIPAGMSGQARLDTLAYGSPIELLAERFHMSEGLLRTLNPEADFGRAGTEILVVAPGGDSLGRTVDRIEVDKAGSAVRAYGPGGAPIASYPATVGSAEFPTPTGLMTVNAAAPDPVYHFDDSGRDWGPNRELTIAPGPNNPVGTTWIDLSRDGYGIHGTPEPRLIGKTASHGCVRLTNWDAAELRRGVEQGARVVFLG